MPSFISLILGRRLANKEQAERKISSFEALPAMGLDAVGSSSYGPEAALAVLVPLGAASSSYIGFVMLPILLLLAILYASYRQTIRAYPSNGGAYTVSKKNIGNNASLVAAAALMIDYVLNVAVGISAGIGALTSAIPALHPYTLWLCLGILVLVTLANLRGTGDAGRAWALPTYLFVVSFLVILAIGIFKTMAAAGSPAPVIHPPAPPGQKEAISLWLLVRSFAAGCTAMTGVEAVSNGVSAFREPVITRAHRTLGAICLILALLLGGITYLAASYGIIAMDQTQEGYQSVLSQLAAAVIGTGPSIMSRSLAYSAFSASRQILASWIFPGFVGWLHRTTICRGPLLRWAGAWSTRSASSVSPERQGFCSLRSEASAIGSSRSLQ